MRRTGTLLGLLACTASCVFAIAPDNGIDALFPFVGRKATGGTASLVAVGQRWVMTAKHVALSPQITFDPNGGGTLYNVDLASVRDIDNTDIRLYRTLDDLPMWAPMDFTPLPNTTYTHAEDAGGNINFTFNGGTATELQMVGYGGSAVLNGGGTGYTGGFFDGRRRAARAWSDSRGTNSLDLGGGNVIGPYASIISFLGVNGDGCLRGGDSGGGLFRNVGGVWKLVGINSAAGGAMNFAGDFDPNTRIFGPNGQLNYISAFAELAPHAREIQSIVPEPAAVAAMALGLAALARKRRRGS